MLSSHQHQHQDLCNLPAELILEVLQHTSFADHARCLLTNQRYEKILTPFLYTRLSSSTPAVSEPVEVQTQTGNEEEVSTSPIRSVPAVVAWAIEHGSIRTLEKINAVWSLELFINSMLVVPIPKRHCSNENINFLAIHLAALRGKVHILEYLLQRGAQVNATAADGLTPIHYATSGEVVHLLARHGCSLDALQGVTPLISSLSHYTNYPIHKYITDHGDGSAVRAYLELGVDPNQASQNGRTAVELAVVANNTSALEILLDAGADVTYPLPEGIFLIYKAILTARTNYGHAAATKVVRILMEHGTPPNSDHVSKVGRGQKPCNTPNMLPVVMMPVSTKIPQLFLERGADQHMPYSTTRGPLDPDALRSPGFETVFSNTLTASLVCAGIAGEGQSIMPGIILRLDNLVHYRGRIYDLMLQICLDQEGRRAQRALQNIPHILALGADDVSCVNTKGDRPLHTLTRHFYPHLQANWSNSRIIYELKFVKPSLLSLPLTQLIDRGADPDAPDAEGKTPLIILCSQWKGVHMALLIQILLRKGVNVNAADRWQCTSLHYAVGPSGAPFEHEHCFRLQILLNYNDGHLDVNVRDNSGRTPLHLLLERENAYIRCGSSTYGRNIYAYDLDRRRTIRRALVMLINAGANVRAKILPSTGSTPFDRHYNAEFGRNMEHIFGSEATDIPASDNVNIGDTPLHLACKGYDSALIDIVLRHGAAADVNSTSRRLKLTPLMMVVGALARRFVPWFQLVPIIQQLLAAGGDPSLRDVNGRTAWDILIQLNTIPSPWFLVRYIKGLAPELTEKECERLLGYQVRDEGNLKVTA